MNRASVWLRSSDRMRNISCLGVQMLFCIPIRVCAAEPSYLPLTVGNQWFYRCNGNCSAEVATVKVERVQQIDPREHPYFVVQMFGREIWFRPAENGRLLARDPETGQEKQWYAFGTDSGQEYETAIHNCNPRARIVAKDASYEGAVGRFSNSLQISYTDTCNFSGLTEETFVPGIGLVQRVENTGTTRYNLVHARVDGRTVPSKNALAFSLVLDRARYEWQATADITASLLARITLANSTGDTVQLTFPTEQKFDLVIRNEHNDIAVRWSEDKRFSTVGQTERILDEFTAVITLPLVDRTGAPLPEGRYTAEAWLTTETREFSSSVAFDIRHSVSDDGAQQNSSQRSGLLKFPQIGSLSAAR